MTHYFDPHGEKSMQLNEVTFLNSEGVLIPYERRPDHLMARAEQLMGIPRAEHDWTAEMVRALPDDGNRYECVWQPLPDRPPLAIDLLAMFQEVTGELNAQP